MVLRQQHTAPVRAITFDLDGTLWDAEPALAQAEQAVHDWLQARHAPLTEAYSISEMRELRRQLAVDHPELRHNVTALRKLSIKVAAEQVGIDSNVSEQAFQIFMQFRNRVQLYDDVLPVLERLHERYTLCSLTNGNADLGAIGIDHFFHYSLSAVETGVAKPQPEMFARLCELTGVAPEETVHVGDEPDTDIAGAAISGYRTVWINRHRIGWQHPWRADAEINSLTDLETVLTSWQARA